MKAKALAAGTALLLAAGGAFLYKRSQAAPVTALPAGADPEPAPCGPPPPVTPKAVKPAEPGCAKTPAPPVTDPFAPPASTTPDPFASAK